MFQWRAQIVCLVEDKVYGIPWAMGYSNFIPNQVKTIKPCQAPWITPAVKHFLRKKHHAYANFMKIGQPDDKLEGIQKMISDGTKLIEDARTNYLRKSGHILANPETSRKNYWSLINSVPNKAKIPIVLPLVENGLFITDFAEKAQILYFNVQQSKVVVRFHKMSLKLIP